MSEELAATQSYVDYQLNLNEMSHDRFWDRIQELERKVDNLQSDLYSAKDKIHNLESQISNLERGY